MKYNIIKYYLSLYVVALLLCLFPISASAHPGSLDSNGGHYNRSTGEYHYHSGEHTDYTSSYSTKNYYYTNYEEAYEEGLNDGYDTGYDDGYKQGYVEKYIEEEAFGIGYDHGYDCGYIEGREEKQDESYDEGYDEGYDKGYDKGYDEGYDNSDNNNSKPFGDLLGITFIYIMLSCIAFALFTYIFRSIYDAITPNLPGKLLSKYEGELDEFFHARKSKRDIIETISKNISEAKDLTSFKLVPDGYEIGEDGLPKEKGANGWGDSLTVYMSRQNGRKIHKTPDCQPIGNKKPLHLYWAQKLYSRSDFCLLCWKSHPHLEWFHEYKSVSKLEHKFTLFQKVVNEECAKISHTMCINTENLITTHNKCNRGFRHFLIKLKKENKEKLNRLNFRYENLNKRSW